MSASVRSGAAFIYVAATLNSLSFGMAAPVLPGLIRQLAGGDAARAALWTAGLVAAWGLTQLVCAPGLGLLSDRIGRRPVLLVSLFGLCLDLAVMAVAPSLTVLLAGRLIGGAVASGLGVANACLVDITRPERRARAFGWLAAASSLGFTAGPALGGPLGQIAPRLPFAVAAALALAGGVAGLMVLRESLPAERRTAGFNWRAANPLGALALLRARPGLFGLAGVGLIFQLGQSVFPTVFVLYTALRYGWTPAVMGLSMLAGTAVGLGVQALLVGPIIARFGERAALNLGLAAGAAGFAIFGLAPTGALHLAGIPVANFAALVAPALQGLMTRRVGPGEQGQLQGAQQALTGLAALAGPPLFGLSFAWAISHDASLHQPGLPILIAAGLLLAGLALASALDPAPEG